MAFLLDTNIISELRKKNANENVIAWYDGVQSHQLHLSAITVGEIRLGIERLRGRDTAQAEVLERWLGTLRTTYRDRIAPVDEDVAEEWGRMNAPNTIPVLDGLLAATASVHGWTFVTRNVADVARTGVAVLNPFEPVPR
ncbi:type II toxin-antitoxin system VapC family toxin [Nocardia amamiensis]|uniref:type II toxin-antitoxin system VapC family toxin n=1 Tax=Nocardia amamiensis TaxID=404578 RepID=UPI00082A499E|nr:type II toxin-antitoxin system VapC family toxin [Nocardia amamiensis]